MKYVNILPQHKYPWLEILYSIVLDIKPTTVIEYGTEHGGTAIVMGLALKQLYEEEQHKGIIHTYDTFEKQSKGEIGSSPNYNSAISNINNYGLQEYVKVDYGDFFEFCDRPNKKFDLLYFDIDNDGEKVLEMYNGCLDNIKEGSVVIFEGGSQIRDDVEWMNLLNKVKINSIKDKVGYQLLTPNQKYSCSIIFDNKKFKL